MHLAEREGITWEAEPDGVRLLGNRELDWERHPRVRMKSLHLQQTSPLHFNEMCLDQ